MPATGFGLAATAVSAAALKRLDGAHDTSAIVLSLALALNAVLWWTFAVVMAFRRPPVRRGPWVRGIALVACASAAAASLHPGAADAGWIAIVASAVVSVASLSLGLASVGRLGRCVGVLPDVRGLVTGGPYRVVRHPLYMGEIGAGVGIVIVAPSMRNLIALAGLVTAQIGRARLEERTLRKAFPAYADYASRTPMLVPIRWPRRVSAVDARSPAVPT